MRRFHVSLTVRDLPASVAFYTRLFDAPPTRLESDYAKWLLDDPSLNFAVTTHGATPGVSHIGMQATDAAELDTLRTRFGGAGRPVTDETATSCCYAKSDKRWVTDPDGVAWEAFLTHEQLDAYGMDSVAQRSGPDTAASADSAGGRRCCDA